MYLQKITQDKFSQKRIFNTTPVFDGRAEAIDHFSHVFETSGSIVSTKSAKSLDSEFVIFNEEKHHTPIEKTSKPAARNNKKVEGTILYFENNVVTCEIELKQNNTMEVKFPISFFTDLIPEIGAAFYIEIDNSSGYRKPLITHRALSPEFESMYFAEMRELIESL